MSNLTTTFSILRQKAISEQKIKDKLFSIVITVLSPDREKSMGIMSILYTSLTKSEAENKCNELIPIIKDASIILRIIPMHDTFFINPEGDVKKVVTTKIEKKVVEPESLDYAAQEWWNLFRQEDIHKNLEEKIIEVKEVIATTKDNLKELKFTSLDAAHYFKDKYNNDVTSQCFMKWVQKNNES